MGLGLSSGITELVEYDPEWEKIATNTIEKLWNIFKSTAKDIQHIGSTAIKNIKAKPIIDIAVAVDDFSKFELLIPELECKGFSYHGWFIPERITVLNVYKKLKPNYKVCTHHIHIVIVDSKEWNEHLNFRNYLNKHPAIAKTYEALKIRLAIEHPVDVGREKYNEGKKGFIRQIQKDAAVWACQPKEI